MSERETLEQLVERGRLDLRKRLDDSAPLRPEDNARAAALLRVGTSDDDADP